MHYLIKPEDTETKFNIRISVIQELMIKHLPVFLACQFQGVQEVLVSRVLLQAPLDQQDLCFPC